MSSIKLKHASGNGVIITAPSSNPAADRTITLPSTVDGTMLTTTNPKTGNIIQVVANNVTATSSVSYGQNTLSTSTPVTATITSTIANSKFIVSCVTNGEATTDDHETHFVLRRIIGGSGTNINVGEGSGGNRQVISSLMTTGYYNDDDATTPSATHLGPFLDSPSQAAGTAITYGMFVMGQSASGTFYYGRSINDSNHTFCERLPNNMMIMEVAP